MKVEIVTQPARPVVMIRHRGSYETLTPKFDQLWEWVEARQVPVEATLGLFYDNAELIPAPQLRSAACVVVPADFHFLPYGAVPLERGEIAGGRYATTTHIGPYEGLEKVWSELGNQIEYGHGLQIPDQLPAFEIYVNDPSDTAPSALVTELYMPVA